MCASLTDASAKSKPSLVELPTAAIRPNDRNPRLIFPQDELDRLAESIDLEGILVPITVFKRADYYVLVDGERRYRCAVTLGLEMVPALIVEEKPQQDVLVQMFNIHLIREPWRDMPTAKALAQVVQNMQAVNIEPTETDLANLTGLSAERVRRLRYVMTLPNEWQTYISDDVIPLNFFWELKRNVIDVLAHRRPTLAAELGGEDAIARAFVEKRLDGVITDTVGLRKMRPIINFAAEDAAGSADGTSILDETIRDLVNRAETSIDDAYEDTVQVMVEVDKLERRTRSMIASFERLLSRARTAEERARIVELGTRFASDLGRTLRAN